MSSRASGFRGVRVRPSGRFTAEIRAGGFRLTLGTYNTPEEAARAYDAAVASAARARHELPDVESLEEAEFLAPPPCLVTDEDRRRHRGAQDRHAPARRALMRRRARSPTRSLLTLGTTKVQRRHRRAVAPSSSRTRIQLGKRPSVG
ncbi:hypothetical protein QYE76_009068 [Lolium multiflorum]|uniref:AP2/ERF domain-containing protein n=1 Tax=Lolium multiflorum TaxID=4521 RepID=A0AAD8X0W6_LOLMU|nr:hypothetical protein QYE76_009068 [Lolium multiflorum]